MIKNLTGGAIIQYGATFPSIAETYDGALFFKTAGSDSGLYIFSMTQDANAGVAGDQVTQSWTTIVNSASFVAKTGDLMTGALSMTGGGAINTPHGRISITLPLDSNSYGFYGLARQGAVGWNIGIDAGNRFFIGTGGSGSAPSLPDQAARHFSIGLDGTLWAGTGAVWHSNNDGPGSGLNADLLDGYDSQYFLDAIAASGPGFTSVQQGGGGGQGPNKLYIGWSSGGVLNLQVDSTNFGSTWPISITGTAVSANTANTATTAGSATNATSAQFVRARGASNGTNMTFFPDAPGGTPTHVWGTSDGVNAFMYPPGSLPAGAAATAQNAQNAQNALYATSAGSVDWNNVSNRPNLGIYIDRALDAWKTSTDGVNRFYFGSNGRTYYSGSDHEFRNVGGSSIMTISAAGNVVAAGDVTAFSDERTKTDVKRIENALDRVEALVGVTFTRKTDGSRGTGLIAQNLQPVLPEAVHEGEGGMLSVAYGNIVGLLVEAIKELRQEVKELKAKV